MRFGMNAGTPSAQGIWILDLAVEDEHVAITDGLVVSVYSADGRQIARLSGRL